MKMIICIAATLFLLAGCALPLTKSAGKKDIGDAIDQGASYLKRAVNEDRYHLACRASDGSACPVDSDDTAFVIRTYRMLGRDVPVDRLLRFYDQNGNAFTTFDGRGPAALVFEPSVDNNFGLHPEVNANIYTLLADSNLYAILQT